MTGLLELWLPIVLSAVAVFVLSSVIHMMTPWHKSDYPKIPNEDRVRDILRPLAIPPGDYMIPRPSSTQEMRSPEFAEKVRQGPVIMMTVMPSGPLSMRNNLIMWFLYSCVVGVFAAYVAGHALPHGATMGSIVRFVGTTAFVGYALALWQNSIWYHKAWLTTTKSTIDSLVYALATGAVFAWLWPGM
jgi:hypothetical protein